MSSRAGWRGKEREGVREGVIEGERDRQGGLATAPECVPIG